MLRPTIFFLALLALTLCTAQAATVTGSFNKTYSLVNDTTQYINLTYLQSISNAYVEFLYTQGGGGNFDNSGGGAWQKWAGFTFTAATTEYAQYRIFINGTSWELYNVTGALEGSGTITDFWSLVNSDGSDIRVFNQNGDQLYFWIESWDYTNQTATIWVNVTAGSTELNIAYGNPSALPSAYNNISLTFKFGDDFITDTWDRYEQNTVTTSNSIADAVTTTAGIGIASKQGQIPASFTMRAKLNVVNDAGDNIRLGVADTASATSWNAWNDAVGLQIDDYGTARDFKLFKFEDAVFTIRANSYAHSLNVWYIVEIEYDGATAYLRVYDESNNLLFSDSVAASLQNLNYVFIETGSSATGEEAHFDYVAISKLADPADVSSFSTGVFATPAQNPKLYLNSNLAASYSGELNETNPSSGKIAIANYWTAENNSLYFVADSGNFDATVTFDYTLNVTESREETFDYVKINTSFYLENGTTTATWQSSFTTSYNYSVKVYVNGAEYSNFSVTESGDTKTVTVNLDGYDGNVQVYVYVNFVASTITVKLIDEETGNAIASQPVKLLDSNYNLIKSATSNTSGYAVLQTVYFGDAFLKAGDMSTYYTRQIEITVPNGQNVSATMYLPSSTSAVAQIVFKINDLTGSYQKPYKVFIKKYVERDKLVNIHTDYADATDRITVYLIVSESYQLSIETGSQTINFGWYVPSGSKEEEITLGEISISPAWTALQKDIKYEFKQEGNLIKLTYNDSSATTTSITFYVFNRSGYTLYTTTAETSNAEFTFNTSGLNETYIKAKFEAYSTKYGNISASKYFFLKQNSLDVGILSFSMKNLLFGGFIVVLAFTFGYRDSRKGAVIISLLAAIFAYAKLLDIPWVAVTLALSYAILAYLAKSAKDWEGFG